MTSIRGVIIGSARGTRRLDNTQSAPSALHSMEDNTTVLDWVLHALERCGVDPVVYVGGYHIEKVIERYPRLQYRFQLGWQREGWLSALGLGWADAPVDHVVVNASSLCVPEGVRRLMASMRGVAVGYYATGAGRRSVGLVAVAQGCAPRCRALASAIGDMDASADLDQWIRAIEGEGITVTPVDLDGLAAPIDDGVAVARMVFGGKGRTLEQVAPLVRSARVPNQVRFNAAEWMSSPAIVLDRIQDAFGDALVLVRSSTHAEDTLKESAAGRFRTVLGVTASQRDRVEQAVSDVIASYAYCGRSLHPMDEVLVQPQVGDLAASGVLFTRDPETGGPYHVINIDRQSGRSDLVTSGAEAVVETFYVSHGVSADRLPSEIQPCVRLARELVALTHVSALDVEFGIGRTGVAYLFQVRPIGDRGRTFELADDDLAGELERIRHFLTSYFDRHPGVVGQTTIFTTMSDWNPAEMIGTTPRPLSLSLYQRLIGDRAWAAARALVGYRDVRPLGLITALCGHPYVDVRASLNSFLPADLEDGIAEPWVDHCLRQLGGNPHLHDKVEFEVAITCLDFDFDRHAGRLRSAGLDRESIDTFRTALLRLTDDILNAAVAPIERQRALLGELERRRRRWLAPVDGGVTGRARQVQALLDDCEQFGTIPFSVLARYAFIAMALLRSLRTAGVFTQEEHETILRSTPTVASELSQDMALYLQGALSRDVLLQRYGHLRPSSYDITSLNYRHAIDLYAARGALGKSTAAPVDRRDAATIFERHRPEIDALLRAHGFSATVDSVRDFVLSSIPAREWAKFEFMKSVDAALEAVAAHGEQLGFSRDDMSFLHIDSLLHHAKESVSTAITSELRRTIEYQKKRWKLTCAIRLPHLISSVDNVSAFRLEDWAPNFISTKRVVAPPVLLEGGVTGVSIDGCIVMIRAADPGYDWIFGHPIAGLITQYGGVGSHMAIRAAEFGIPAAIGCGERIFNRICSAPLIELDCSSKTLRAVT